jgi:hypothetical protein
MDFSMASSESAIAYVSSSSDWMWGVGNRHVTRTPAMPDPAEDVPADRPVRWGDRQFEFGTPGPGVARTGPIRAVVQFADQLHRAFERVNVPIPMIAEGPPASADGTSAVEDVEFPVREIGILGPLVRHRADPRTW